MSKEASFEGVIVAAYVDEGAANEVLESIKKAKKDETFQYWDAVVIRKDERGRYFYDETKDMSAPKGAGIGAVIGGLIGLPGGPAGVVLGAGVGAALGGVVANADAGIKDERLEDVGYALESSNSALLLVSDQDYLLNMREYAGEEDTIEAMKKLTNGISAHMVRGQNVAYTITAAGRSVSCHDLELGSEIASLLRIEQAVD
jgi:uncharacterized membrane protein